MNGLVSTIDIRPHVAPGPDLRPDNYIDVILGDKILERVEALRLPIDFKIAIPVTLARSGLGGAIQVTGPCAGIRQVSISHLYVGH